MTVEVPVEDGVGTAAPFGFTAPVSVAEVVSVIEVVREPALVQIDAGAQLGTALNPAGILTFDGAPVTPTIAWFLDGFAATATTFVAAGQVPSVSLVYSAAADELTCDLVGVPVGGIREYAGFHRVDHARIRLWRQPDDRLQDDDDGPDGDPRRDARRGQGCVRRHSGAALGRERRHD